MTKTHEDRWRAFVGAVAPACDALPDLSEADFTKLVDDVGRHGIREAAIYWQPTESDNTGRCLVSGRHRYRANEALGKSPDEVPSRTVFGGNPLDWAVSLDVRRRHLTAVERTSPPRETAKASS